MSLHSSLNTSNGVIRYYELRGVCEDEILENLKPEGVTHVKRFNVKRNGFLVPTNTFVLPLIHLQSQLLSKLHSFDVRLALTFQNPSGATIANSMDTMSFGAIEALSVLIAQKQQRILLTSVKIKQSARTVGKNIKPTLKNAKSGIKKKKSSELSIHKIYHF